MSRPLCLYDFTLKSIVTDFTAFRIHDYKPYGSNPDINVDYFYDKEFKIRQEELKNNIRVVEIEEESKEDFNSFDNPYRSQASGKVVY